MAPSWEPCWRCHGKGHLGLLLEMVEGLPASVLICRLCRGSGRRPVARRRTWRDRVAAWLWRWGP